MNNLYNWHDERMNEIKQREVRKELEQIRLVKEATENEAGWFESLADSLGNFLASWKQKRQEARHSHRYAHHSVH